MDMIMEILKSLDIDKTYFYQLAIVVVFFFILRNLVFVKLQEVLEDREAKTTKLEGSANKQLVDSEKMKSDYQESIDQAQTAAFTQMASKKEAIVTSSKEEVKSVSDEVEKEVEEQRVVAMKEVEEHKNNILSQANELSEKLVEKVIQ